MAKVKFSRNFEDFLKLYLSASVWRKNNSPVYSRVWDPQFANEDTYLEEFKPHQAYVMYINGIPTGGVVLSDPKEAKFSLWSDKFDDNTERGALYVDDLCIDGGKIGQGLIKELFKQIETFAADKGYSRLRLDTDLRLGKLIECYKRNGFKLIHKTRDDHMDRTSVYMEKVI